MLSAKACLLRFSAHCWWYVLFKRLCKINWTKGKWKLPQSTSTTVFFYFIFFKCFKAIAFYRCICSGIQENYWRQEQNLEVYRHDWVKECNRVWSAKTTCSPMCIKINCVVHSRIQVHDSIVVNLNCLVNK